MAQMRVLTERDANFLCLLGVEFGYKGCERGWNIQKTLYEAKKILRKSPHTPVQKLTVVSKRRIR